MSISEVIKVSIKINSLNLRLLSVILAAPAAIEYKILDAPKPFLGSVISNSKAFFSN